MEKEPGKLAAKNSKEYVKGIWQAARERKEEERSTSSRREDLNSYRRTRRRKLRVRGIII